MLVKIEGSSYLLVISSHLASVLDLDVRSVEFLSTCLMIPILRACIFAFWLIIVFRSKCIFFFMGIPSSSLSCLFI